MPESATKKPIRILMVEDSDDDELLVLRELRRSFEVKHERVQTPDAMRAALEKPWDLVLSDYTMPHFSGLGAIEVLAESGKEVPLIIVSGTIGEETAVGALQAGASDYVLKQRLARLVPAIERALREHEGKIARRRAEQASLSKSRFLASMSHELRTPLNAIIGFADILLSGDVPPESPSHREFLGDILESGHHLLRLINDVLDLSKVEAERLEFRPEPLNFAHLAEEVASVVRATAAANGVAVVVDAGAIDRVVLDGVRLKQVLFNYLSNATKFTPDGGTVKLTARPEGAAMFRIEVSDTGAGIAPDDLQRLFVEFAQVGPQSGNPTGTGLGLALTKRLVEAQGGRVGVESTVGRGSTFFAILPRDAGAPAEPEAAGPPSIVPSDEPRVFVVDDDPISLALVQAALTPLGCRIATFTGAEAALERARREPPAAVVLDLVMPGLDGHGFLERFPSVPGSAKIPVVVWTAKDLGAAEEQRLARVASAVKIKGKDGPLEIAAAIKRALGRA